MFLLSVITVVLWQCVRTGNAISPHCLLEPTCSRLTFGGRGEERSTDFGDNRYQFGDKNGKLGEKYETLYLESSLQFKIFKVI